MAELDIAWVREQFSLPENIAFFDNAGGSFTLNRVIDRVAEYMRETPVQLGARHRLSVQASNRLQHATADLAAMIGAQPDEVVIGPASSSLTDRLARAMRGQLRTGDRIIVTQFDHESNISPWLRLADHDLEIVIWELNESTGQVELDDLEALLTERTRLLACTHCTNITGDPVAIGDIRRLTKQAGCQLMVDGVAYAPHRQVNMAELDVDYYVISLYKVFGPHIGLLYGKREALDRLDNINLAHMSRDDVPYKLQPGGTCYELLYGAAGIAHYLQELGNGNLGEAFSLITKYEEQLTRQFLNAMNDTDFIVHGSTGDNPQRLPIMSFHHPKLSAVSICEQLDRHNIAAKHGHFHARRLIQRYGLDPNDGVVRVSMAHYNTSEEVERLIEQLKLICG